MSTFDGYTLGELGSGFSVIAATPLTIEILNSRGDVEREIALSGACLPSRQLELAVEQRVVKSRPQGNPRASLQMLGPEYPDTQLEGKWKQQLMTAELAASSYSGGGFATLDGTPIATVRALAEIFTDLVETGRFVRFTWDVQVRYGTLQRFAPTWMDAGEVQWSMTFMWSSRLPRPAVSTPIEIPLPPSMAASWFDQLLGVLDDAMAAIAWVNAEIFDPVVQALQRAAVFNGKLVALITAAAKLLVTPVELATQAITCFQGMLAAIADAVMAAAYLVTSALSRLASVAVGFEISASGPGLGFDINDNSGDPVAPTTAAAASADSKATIKPAVGTVVVPGVETTNVTALELTLVEAPTIPFMPVIDAWGFDTVPELIPEIYGFETVPDLPPGAGATVDPDQQAPGDVDPGTSLGSLERQKVRALDIPLRLRRLQRELKAVMETYRARAAAQLKLRAIYVASGRDDLRDVAQRFYSDHRGWAHILRFNRADNSLLSTGQIVLVPDWDGTP